MKLSAPPPPPPEPPEPPEPDKPGDPAATTPAPPADATPAAKSAPQPATWPRWYAAADVVLAALAVALAFLVASFAARNSDLWVHLAAGKRLVGGGYRLGSDPFSYTAADRPWVNHSWLFDLGAYLLYGGTGFVLVLVKALAVAAAAGLLLAIRRPPFPLWPWAACVVLALLAAAPRLALGPQVASVLMLALTLFLVLRVPSPPGSWRLPIALGVTFWLWANLDQWFFLGPLAVGLLLVGELLQRKVFKRADEPADDEPEPLGRLPDTTTLARALLVGIVACVLNPHHVRVWALPIELTGSSSLAAADPSAARALLLAPIDQEYLNEPWAGYNLNGLAYAVLVIGGGVALGFGGGRLRLAYLVLWVGFLLLSLRTVVAVPFFAVVAVPLVAAQLNVVSARAKLGTRAEAGTRMLLVGSSAGRVLCVLALLVLGARAWPGWLHPTPNDPAEARRVAWAVEPDPALVKAAGQLEAWRDGGRLADEDHGFLAAAALADYCAWYAPRERVFLNSRFAHHRPELPDFAAVRANLGLTARADPPDPKVAREVFDSRKVSYSAVSAGPGDSQEARDRTRRTAVGLWSAPQRWAAWYLDGRTYVFGWRPAPDRARPAFDALRLDPAALAFGPAVERLPAGAVVPPPPERSWEDDFVRPVRPAPAGAAEALAWMEYLRVTRQQENIKRQQLQLLALRVAPRFGLPLSAADAQARVEDWDRRTVRPELGAHPDLLAPWPPRGTGLAAPVLALRAARRAIAANPDHPDGYFALAEVLEEGAPSMSEMERIVARVTACRQCLARMPPPGEFKRGVYAASPTGVARALAMMYLGPQLPDPGQMAGPPQPIQAEGPPYPELGGAFSQTLLALNVRGQRSQVLAWVPGVRAPDLARQALVLANDYAAVELPPDPPDLPPGAPKRQAFLDEMKAFQKRVEEQLRVRNDRYRPAADRKLLERYQAARALDLTGEAIQLLKDGLKDGGKELGPQAPIFAVQMIALEMRVGRIEEAAADLDELAAAFEQPGRTGSDPQMVAHLRRVLRYLSFQKNVLIGNYPDAGTDLEDVEGPLVGLGGLQEEVKRRGFDPRPFAALGAGWPVVTMLGAQSPLGVVALFWGGEMQARNFQGIRGTINRKMQADADFFFRRGFLALLEGDIPAARGRFQQTVREPPPGWNLPTVRHGMAEEYLRLIDAAEK